MSTLDIYEVIRSAHRDGGGTFVIVGHDADGFKFDHSRLEKGFYVGQKGGIENLPTAALTPEVINAFIESSMYLPNFLGLWRDPEGKWSIDNVFHIEDFDYALKVGADNAQRAIWDIAWGTEWAVPEGEYAR